MNWAELIDKLSLAYCWICWIKCWICWIKCWICWMKCWICWIKFWICWIKYWICWIKCWICWIKCWICWIKCKICWKIANSHQIVNKLTKLPHPLLSFSFTSYKLPHVYSQPVLLFILNLIIDSLDMKLFIGCFQNLSPSSNTANKQHRGTEKKAQILRASRLEFLILSFTKDD